MSVRTTLTIDDDVARLIDEAVHRERRPMKQVVNDALRRALEPAVAAERFTVEVHHSALVAGIDPGALNGLADDLADDDQIASATRG